MSLIILELIFIYVVDRDPIFIFFPIWIVILFSVPFVE